MIKYLKSEKAYWWKLNRNIKIHKNINSIKFTQGKPISWYYIHLWLNLSHSKKEKKKKITCTYAALVHEDEVCTVYV